MLKERLEHTVLVFGTAIKERVDDLSDVLDALTRLEMRLFKYGGVAMSRTFNEKRPACKSPDVRRAASKVTAEGVPHEYML